MVLRFHNQENDYEKWCQENQYGYVFNNAGGRTGNVLHLVSCRHLNTPSRIGTYTTRYPKYCSTEITLLSSIADDNSKPFGWRRCKDCIDK